jgi:hypothetical protein
MYENIVINHELVGTYLDLGGFAYLVRLDDKQAAKETLTVFADSPHTITQGTTSIMMDMLMFNS